MPSTEKIDRLDGVRRGELDVGRLFVDTKQVYLDARQNAAEFNEPRLRVDAMFAIFKMLGLFLRKVGTLRLQITRGEVGLKGFDADLAGVQQRYRNLYEPFFETMPPPTDFTVEQWQSFEETLEGPILLWDLKTCQERWGIPFNSLPCEGPDLLTTLSLLHQVGAAEEVQRALIESAYGLADLTMREVGEYWGGHAQALGDAIARGFKKIVDNAKDYFPNTNTSKNIALGVGAVLAVGAGGYLWIKTRK